MRFVITPEILKLTRFGLGLYNQEEAKSESSKLMRLDNQAMEAYLICSQQAQAHKEICVDCTIKSTNFDLKVPRKSHEYPQISNRQYSALKHGKGKVDFYAFYRRTQWPQRPLVVGDEVQVELFKVLSYEAYIGSIRRTKYPGQAKPLYSTLRKLDNSQLDPEVLKVLQGNSQKLSGPY